jgi:hypothetical protein
MRYMPASSHYDRLLVAGRTFNSAFNIANQPLWLMRGVDRSGKNDFDHGHAMWRERYARGLNVAANAPSLVRVEVFGVVSTLSPVSGRGGGKILVVGCV